MWFFSYQLKVHLEEPVAMILLLKKGTAENVLPLWHELCMQQRSECVANYTRESLYNNQFPFQPHNGSSKLND